MKKFYLKERFNPQFEKPYYIKYGQLTKKEANNKIMKKEDSVYIRAIMYECKTESKYLESIAFLIKNGYTVN
jgi:hypothetical protein